MLFSLLRRKTRFFLLFCLLFVASKPFPASSQTPQPQADDPLALGFHLGRGDAQHIEAARAAGADFAVVVFSWADIEPDPNYLYWAEPDAALRAAEFYGLDLIARLDQPPAWALDDNSPTPFNLDAYANFARRVAERYGDRLAGLILWNEPNLNLEWNNQPPDATAYVELLKAAYPAVKAAAPEVPVAMAGLASTEGEGNWAVNDLDYLQALYDNGAAAYFDVLTAHPYGFGRPPDDPPAKFRPNFRRLELYRDIMAAHGDADKPVWVTELGWLTWTDDPKSDWQVVTPQVQADYILRAIDYSQSNYPWLTRLGIWQLNVEGDEYGFGIWHGPDDISPAYTALVDAFGPGQPDAPNSKFKTQNSELQILAPDAIIRLGDRDTLHPHWVHLYRGGSLTWRGEFFLTPEQTEQPYDLLLETMQVTQPTNRLAINGSDVARLQTRARPDITSTWVTQRFSVPAELLQPGLNTVSVSVGPRNPARQYNTAHWENMQLRNMRLAPPPAPAVPLFDDWQPQPSPGGWSEISRLRTGFRDDLWLAGNRPGHLWQLASTPPFSLTSRSDNRPDLVFNDILPLPQGQLAATDQGLFWHGSTTPGSDVRLLQPGWQPLDGPAVHAYVVRTANGQLYAGFEGEGLWTAPSPAGPWQRTALTATTVVDLASQPYRLPDRLTPVEQLYAVAPGAIFANNGLDEQWQRLPLPGLSREELEENGEFYGDKLSPRLTIASDGTLVVRHQDRLWIGREQVASSRDLRGASSEQLVEAQGQSATQNSELKTQNSSLVTHTWQLFGPEHLHGKLFSVANCCGAGTVVGTNKAGVWRLDEDGGWQRLDDGFFDTVDATALLKIGETLLAGGGDGLFYAAADAPWQRVAGLPSIVSDLLVDPVEAERWLAGTPGGVYLSRDAGQTWQAISPPWTVWDLAVGAEGRLLVGRSAGLGWSDDLSSEQIDWQVADGLEKVFFLRVKPDPVDPARVWSGTWGNNIAASSDGGQTVAPVHNGLETLTGLDLIWHPTPGQVTLATIEGLYRTDDGGQSWFKLPGPLMRQTVHSLHQSDDGAIWAGAADGLWVSRDYGVTWEQVESIPPAAVLRLGRIEVPPPSPVWQVPFGWPPANAQVYRPQAWLWAGLERGGLWLSRDEGLTWQLAGLPERTVYALLFDPFDPRRLIAATDRGLFATSIGPR